MRRNTNDALSIAISNSIKVTREHLGGNTYRVTRRFTTNENISVGMMLYAVQKRKEEPEKAALYLKQRIERGVQGEGGGSFWFLIPIAVGILTMLALGKAPDSVQKYSAPLFLIVGALVFAAIHLLNARKRRANKIWASRETNADGVLKALNSMDETLNGSVWAAASKPVLAICLVGVLCLGGYMILDSWPDPAHVQLSAMVGDHSVSYVDCGEFIQDKDGKVGSSGQKTLKKAWENAENDAMARFDLAVVAVNAIPQGFDAETAAGYAKTVLAELDAGIASDKARFDQVSKLLETAPEAADDRLLKVLAEICAKRVSKAERIIRQFWGEIPLQKLLTFRRELIGEKKPEAADMLVRLYAKEKNLEQVRADLTSVPEDELLALTQIYGSNYTALDDVLAFIRLSGELGIKPSECYPEGVKLNLHTSHFKYVEAELSEDQTLAGLLGSYLVISRTEAEEPFEKKAVPMSRWAYGNMENPMYPDDYEGNTSRGDAAYTVVLETGMMDHMAPENIPETFAECQVLLVIDQFYTRCGFIRNTQYTETKIVTGQWDIPAYLNCSSMAFFLPESGDMLYMLDWEVSDYPQLPQKQFDHYFFSDNELQENYLVRIDPAVAARMREELQQAMSSRALKTPLEIMLWSDAR